MGKYIIHVSGLALRLTSIIYLRLVATASDAVGFDQRGESIWSLLSPALVATASLSDASVLPEPSLTLSVVVPEPLDWAHVAGPGVSDFLFGCYMGAGSGRWRTKCA